ncbi:endonuclease V [Candidatus Woesearchaeota archaeon]|nr:endonuclease V [Candidatus Woesearchaeota archaeon]
MNIDFNKLKETQKKIAETVVLKDSFKLESVSTIAGFDLAYHKKKVICAAVVLDLKTMKIIEKKRTVSEEKFPYIANFLMFREGPPIIGTYHELETKPDIIMIDGGGVLHPLKSGVATYVGVSLDKPSIGVTKKLLCGEVYEGKIYVEKDTIKGKVKDLRGERVETKIGSRPIFVSPGHKISITTSVKIVHMCLSGNHKLPEPLRLAHRYADDLRQELVGKENKEPAEQD